VIFICFSKNINALEVQYYGIEARILKNMTLETSVTFLINCSEKKFDYEMIYDIYDFSYNIKNGFGECIQNKKNISCEFLCEPDKNTINIKLNFNTAKNVKKVFDKYEFSASYPIQYNTQRIFILVYLPQTATLPTDVPNESFSPKYGQTLTDGKHIIVYWEKHNLTKGESFDISVKYNLPSPPRDPSQDFAVITLTIVIIMIMIGMGTYMRRSKKDSINLILPLLKKEEKVIIDILNKYNGETFQRTLVRESNFSKATVSRLVNSLKERGIIEVEPLGRTNKIKLKLKK
jgi:uncharacterized membrane protein